MVRMQITLDRDAEWNWVIYKIVRTLDRVPDWISGDNNSDIRKTN